MSDTPSAAGAAPGLDRTVFETLVDFDPVRQSSLAAIAQRVARYDQESRFGASLMLTCDLASWAGTFSTLVDALLTDLLAEGPVRALVAYFVPADPCVGRPEEIMVVATGTVTAYRDDVLVFADGRQVPTGEDLAAVCV